MKEKLLKLEEAIVKTPTIIKSLYCEVIEEIKLSFTKLKDISTTNFDLGIHHMDCGNISDAKMRFMLVIKLKPEIAMAHYHLGRCHMFNLAFDKAKAEFEITLNLDPTITKAKYRLDLINHQVTDLQIPTEVTREDYNTLSKNYENYMLNQLGYNAYDQLAVAMVEFIKETHKVIDLGCGTGLSGASLVERSTIKSLTGVDLSTKMLEFASLLKIENSPVYTQVKELDFNNLEQLQEKFDVITACMSFGYAGDLDKVFKNLDNISAKEAILGLVVLKSTNDQIEFNYDYASLSFNEIYLNSIFKKYKWSIKKQEEVAIFSNNTLGLMFILEKN
jgi:predicted TPR repeat methyltransferase